MRLGVLRSFDPDWELYARACTDLGVDYRVVDFIGPAWMEECESSGCDGFLARPPADFPERKALYDERLLFLVTVMNRRVYPSLPELLLYENKRFLAYCLSHHRFPHVETRVFAEKRAALDFAADADYPFVSKRSIGAGGRTVTIVRSRRHARRLIQAIFGYGLPGLTLGKQAFGHMGPIPVPLPGMEQKHYAIFQDYVDIKWEWRVIRIGRSYFGHQKLPGGPRGLASGSRLIGWARPPDALLHLVRDLCDRLGFRSMAVDVFETGRGEHLVNELQTVFGFHTPHQMILDGVAGRFVYEDGAFRFEEGEFTRNGCYDLRVLHFLEELRSG